MKSCNSMVFTASITSLPMRAEAAVKNVYVATMQSVESWEQSPRIQGCIAVMAGEIRLIDNIRIK